MSRFHHRSLINSIRKLFIEISKSTTFNTWMSYGTKALSIFLVLPLILNRFTAEQVTLWYLFASIIAIGAIADFGFKGTFVRIISYLKVKDDENHDILSMPEGLSSSSIISYLLFIYAGLSILGFSMLSVFGTLLISKPISNIVSENNYYWVCWIIVIITSILRLFGNVFVSILEGHNKIVIARRNEIYCNLGLLISSVLILKYSPDFMILIVNNQFWLLLVVLLNYFSLDSINRQLIRNAPLKISFNNNILLFLWRPAWKSGLSGFMSNGLTYITSLLYAQIADPNIMASYLIALKLITQVRDFSMAPFYSKIPILSTLRAKGDILRLKLIAQKGMLISYTVFVMGVILIDMFAIPLLNLIGSNVEWVDSSLWMILSLAFIVHRFGAMHVQLYSTTNTIISHIADGISGSLFLLSSYLLLDLFEIYSIPIGMLIGYVAFYSWYAAYHSYKSIDSNFIKFEIRGIIIPIFVFIIYNVLTYVK